ncbi:MAG: helix-turn-helix transcriptional regulator [Asticcacaulis sp.]|uniref:AraC family transcriptional regulator n=1 Tax=Asticcacaulis sp. TaxID=1872648 RepID=UPI0039E2F874
MKRTADLPRKSPPVVGFEDRYTAGFVDEAHAHDRTQLSIVLSGSLTVNTDEASFVLNPGQGMWIPAGLVHRAICRAESAFQVLYFDPEFSEVDIPCRMFEVSALLRGLIDEIVAMRYEFVMDERMLTIAKLLVGEIERAPRVANRTPFPSDYRLRRVCEAIITSPGDSRDIDHWAREAGMSRRTFTRVFQTELGMGFAAWRRRVRVIEGTARINAGQSIAEVAFDLGYDNPGSFSTMFRRVFGVPPHALRSGRAGPLSLDP